MSDRDESTTAREPWAVELDALPEAFEGLTEARVRRIVASGWIQLLDNLGSTQAAHHLVEHLGAAWVRDVDRELAALDARAAQRARETAAGEAERARAIEERDRPIRQRWAAVCDQEIPRVRELCMTPPELSEDVIPGTVVFMIGGACTFGAGTSELTAWRAALIWYTEHFEPWELVEPVPLEVYIANLYDGRQFVRVSTATLEEFDVMVDLMGLGRSAAWAREAWLATQEPQ